MFDRVLNSPFHVLLKTSCKKTGKLDKKAQPLPFKLQLCLRNTCSVKKLNALKQDLFTKYFKGRFQLT